MKTHQEIDRRSLALARAVVAKIDDGAARKGFAHARETCARWFQQNPTPAVAEWMELLQHDWITVRAALLADSEAGQRRRQNSPFCGVLTPAERWAIYQRFSGEPKAA